MLKTIFRRICAASLAVSLLGCSASALERSKVETEFDAVLYEIERYGLFAEDHPLSDAQRAMCNLRIAGGESLSSVVNRILAQHDSHSFYMTPEEYNENFSTLTSGYVGIGITVQMIDGSVVITAVNYSGPAREAGIEVGDVIVSVNGVPLAGKSLDDAGELLQGKEGSTVRLVVQRAGKNRSFSVVRRAVNTDYVWSQTIADGVEYIAIEAFASMDDAQHFADLWDGLDEKATAAVILDLRGNGGGLIDSALDMLDTMLPRRTQLVNCRWRRDQGGTQQIWCDGGGLPLNGIFVLVDENTASAAEMMAACLKDNNQGVLVGEQTYGKSLGQFHLSMPNGDSLIITTLEMSTPRTGVWEGKGIVPNVKVDSLVKVSEYLKDTPALSTGRALLFGETGQNVYAMTERLRLLGYLAEPSDKLDSKVLLAVREFQRDVGLPEALCADIGTLGRLNNEILSASSLYVDNALEQAVKLAKQAAEQPLQYTANADGSWTAA